MLHLTVNKQELMYDLYALTQAFYPGVELETREAEREGLSEAEQVSAETASGQEKNTGENMQEDMGGLQDAIEVCLFEDGGRMAITAGEVLPATFGKRFTEAEILREAEIFLNKGTEKNAARKRALKNLFYDAMTQYTGRELPWGNLTGIRPTKLIRGLLQNNTNQMLPDGTQTGDSAVTSQLYCMHRLKGEKLALGMEIARLQEGILSKLHGLQGYSVYIGIPFCPSRCLYCSFTSNPVDKWKKRIGEYLDALKKELAYVADVSYFRTRTLDTVYIGGGTPTALSAEELDRLLGDIASALPMEDIQEFTVEAGRADSITAEKLNILKKYHVTRISVNPQTMKEETLRKIGRRHTVEEVKDAFATARAVGFDNINMDIILGLPGETDADVANTVRELKKLSPDSLTVHSLAVKRAAGLKDWYKETGDPRADGAEEVQHMMERAMKIASEGARDMGMKPYYLYRQKNMAGNLENTGYSLPDKYGLYNILIMEEVQTIVALGAGSITKRVYPDGRIERCDNVKDVAQYIDRIGEMIERKRGLLSD